MPHAHVPAGARHARRSSRSRLAAALLLLPAAGLLATSCAKSEDAADVDGAIKVEITDEGCQPSPAEAPSGEVTFAIANAGSAKATEAELKSSDGNNILGEKENLTEGLKGSFKLNLREGTYKMFCPGAKQDTWDFTVTKGAAVKDWKDNPLLVEAVQGYSDYVDEQATELGRTTTAFTDAVRAGDVAQAKDLYGPAREPYERIEPVAESFGDLDPKIDGRADDGVEPEDLTGFHRLEYALWVEGDIASMGPVADQLDADIVELQDLVAGKRGAYVPEEIANGATELMNEVMTGKMPGEEERYSHTDLIDFQANLDGSLQAVDLLRPVLETSAPELIAKIDGAAQEVQEGLDGYQADPGYAGTGFVEWGYVEDPASKIDADQRRELSDLVKPLAELLAEVPIKVVV